ncbi:MAG: hypothetical protein RL218_343 [Actinomycetota bacterium]
MSWFDNRCDFSSGCFGLHVVVGRLLRGLLRRSALGRSLLHRLWFIAFGFGLLGGLLCRLLHWLCFFRLLLANQSIAFGTCTNSVGLLLDDRRGKSLDADRQLRTQIKGLLIRHAELFGELVDTQQFLRQVVTLPTRSCRRPTALGSRPNRRLRAIPSHRCPGSSPIHLRRSWKTRPLVRRRVRHRKPLRPPVSHS